MPSAKHGVPGARAPTPSPPALRGDPLRLGISTFPWRPTAPTSTTARERRPMGAPGPGQLRHRRCGADPWPDPAQLAEMERDPPRVWPDWLRPYWPRHKVERGMHHLAREDGDMISMVPGKWDS